MSIPYYSPVPQTVFVLFDSDEHEEEARSEAVFRHRLFAFAGGIGKVYAIDASQVCNRPLTHAEFSALKRKAERAEEAARQAYEDEVNGLGL